MVRPAGLEPATYGSANRRSIQLSHGRINCVLSGVPLTRVTIAFLCQVDQETLMGI